MVIYYLFILSVPTFHFLQSAENLGNKYAPFQFKNSKEEQTVYYKKKLD